jgi:hypothetical protein
MFKQPFTRLQSERVYRFRALILESSLWRMSLRFGLLILIHTISHVLAFIIFGRWLGDALIGR